MLTVTQFKDKVTPKLHGTSLAKVSNFYGKLAEAAGNLLLKVDPYTTIRRARLENAIYDKVYNYTAPSDIKGIGKIIDIRPIGNEREGTDYISGTYSRHFDMRKEFNTTAIEVIDGVKTIRLSKDLTPRTVIHEFDSISVPGTITGGGDVTGLTTDTLEHVSGTKSVKFNLSGSTGAGTITIALDSTMDLTDQEDVGALFEWLKFPLASALTSVQLKWGNDSSNYWTTTETAFHDRAFDDNAWGLLRHDWNDTTEAGSPDKTLVDWFEITINYTSGTARNNVRLDTMTVAKGEAWEMLYYSNALFKSAAGSYLTVPTADSDVIQLENDSDNGLLYEFMRILNQELKGENAAKDFQFYNQMLEGEGGFYPMYELNYPSQSIEQQISYYDFGNLDDNYGN